MTYGRFAYVYDRLMEDVPYEDWIRIVIEKAGQYRVKGKNVLDVGCGTGEISLRLAQEGYRVTGVDLSEEMLTVAQSKAEAANIHIPFYQQNMAHMEGLGEYDIVGIFCDSLNYLTSEQEVKQTFIAVYEHLIENGLFIFDVHSVFKMTNIFKDQTFACTDDDVSYIWNCFEGDAPLSVVHELTFFALDESTNQYERFDEDHVQRTYSISQYKKWLMDAGFQVLEVFADFIDKPPTEQSERIFFIAKK